MIICSSRNASEYLLRAVFFGVCSRDLFFFFPLCHHGNTAKINYVCKVSFLTSNTLVAKYWIKGIIIFKYIWISFYIKKLEAFCLKASMLTFSFRSLNEWLMSTGVDVFDQLPLRHFGPSSTLLCFIERLQS